MKSESFNIPFKISVHRVISFLLFLGFVTPFFAQSKDTIATQQIDEVMVKAKRMPRQVMAPIPVQAFSGEYIQKIGFQNMADAVQRFSGTTVRDYGGIGGLKTVSVRSLGPHHTGVVYDGVAVSNCQAGQIDIGRFFLDNVSVLSLTVGNTDNLMQSARMFASGSVLEIQTQTPSFDSGRKFGVNGFLRLGSFGQVNPYLRFIHKLSKRTSISLDGDFLRADGKYPFILTNGTLKTKEKRKNSDIVSFRTEADLYHTFKDESKLDVKTYYFNSERGLPGKVILYVDKTFERLWDENFFAQARYKKTFNSQWQMQVQGKYNYSWNKYQDIDPNGNANGKQIDINRQNEYYLSSTAVYTPWDFLSFSLAQDLAFNTLRNNYTYNSTMDERIAPNRTTSLTAFNVKFLWKGLNITGGLLDTYTYDKLNKTADGNNRNQLTPSLSVSYKPFKQENLNVRMLFKKSYRLPTFNDLYYLHMGNALLKPERATEYNLGIGWSTSLGKVIDHLMINVDGFYNNVKDKIVVFPAAYVARMANYGRVDIHGLDVNASMNVVLTNKISMMLNGGYTYQKAIDLTDPAAKNYKDQIPYTPLHTGNASLSLDTPLGSCAYSFMGVDKRYTSEQNLPENEVKGYFEQNLSYAKSFKWRKIDWTFQMECVNLMNIQYDVIRYYPMPGRSFRGTLKFKF